ncbi:MAG: hypothetical protein P9X24_18235 [Candidatus Hatepunaea meridiana]|nr:hypothetical protein [Candidatus Hatepunaea meridiana]
MKIKIYLLFVLLSPCIFLNIKAQTEPEYHPQRYYSECWLGEGSSYASDIKPDTGLFAIIDIGSNEPVAGYPMHSGIVTGVSDTVTLFIKLFNRNSESFDISSHQPENWFVPLLYESNADVRKFKPISEIPESEFIFLGWFDWHYESVSKPSVIPYSGNDNVRYHLRYYVWNLPVGRYRLLMKKTDQAPEEFRILTRYISTVWIKKPMNLTDTLNAFAACVYRAISISNFTAALSWTDSIFAYNPTSITGYKLQTAIYYTLDDSLATITGFDSTLAIADRYGDPALPDSADMNKWERIWLQDIINSTTYARWMFITGTRRIFH